MLVKITFSNLFFSQYKGCDLRSYIIPGHNSPSLLYGNCLPCIIIFQKPIRSEMKQRSGERVHGDLRQVFFTCRNQLDSYYHLALLMSLVGKTKLLSVPRQTALGPGLRSLRGSAEHLKIRFKVFCLLKKLNSQFFSFKRNILFRRIVSC